LQTYFKIDDFRIAKAKPPPKLEQLMGVWGSIFYVTIKEILDTFGVDLPLWMRWMVEKISILPGVEIANVNYNRVNPETGELLPMANQKFIGYRDATVISNVPIPPMLRPERGVDLLVVLDASAFDKNPPPYNVFYELVTAVPSIKDAVPAGRPTRPYVFPATKDYPTIIYIPLLVNKEFDPHFDPIKECNTFKFVYDSATTTKLERLAYYWTKQAEQQIWDAVRNLLNAQTAPSSRK